MVDVEEKLLLALRAILLLTGTLIDFTSFLTLFSFRITREFNLSNSSSSNDINIDDFFSSCGFSSLNLLTLLIASLAPGTSPKTSFSS